MPSEPCSPSGIRAIDLTQRALLSNRYSSLASFRRPQTTSPFFQHGGESICAVLFEIEMNDVLACFGRGVLVGQADLQDVGVEVVQQAVAQLCEKLAAGIDRHEFQRQAVQA